VSSPPSRAVLFAAENLRMDLHGTKGVREGLGNLMQFDKRHYNWYQTRHIWTQLIFYPYH
jgi:hypothetical protein